ncbi:hypothetical protein A6E92_01765 [Streptomyces sp. S8]|nr:hypothetical protein A6E92_01765 [Streptomyces sp. S8]
MAALPPLEATVAEGHPDGAAGALVCLLAQHLRSASVSASTMPWVWVWVWVWVRVLVRSWVEPGNAGEAHNRRPNGSVRTWTFMPWRLCSPE